jgi:hypothetical protein
LSSATVSCGFPEGKNLSGQTRRCIRKSYQAAEKLLAMFSLTLADAATKRARCPLLFKAYGERNGVPKQSGVGVLTLRDIVGEADEARP